MMRVDSWCATALDGRTVKYAYKELSDGIAAISATIEGWSVMIFQKGVRAPLTRDEVESMIEENPVIGNLLPGRRYEDSVQRFC